MSKICDRGNVVVLDKDGSYIQTKASGLRTYFPREQAVFMYYTRTKKGR